MNKCLNVIGILLGLLLFTCCGKEAQKQSEARCSSESHVALAEIDSLMWRRADSAFVLLQEFVVGPEAEELDTFDGHYCQLLISELLYKNDCEQTNRKELLQAVAYFDSLVRLTPPPPLKGGAQRAGDSKKISNPTPNLTFLTARAHYINGVGYYENDSIVQACAEYLKTLELMESHFEDKALIDHKARFMALTYGRLGEMFNEQLLAEPAIVCYKQALYYCKREPTSIYGIPVLLYNLGIQYDVANQKDSAAFYYDKALANLPDYDNIHYRDIITSKSVLAFNLGICVDSVIKDLKYVISLTSDDIERTYRFLTLGNILFESGMYDSSRFYLETVFEQQDDIQSKIVAAENLCNIYQKEGDSVNARKYYSYLADFTMAEIEKKKDISRINELFKNHLAQKQEKQAELKREKAVKKALWMIIPIAIVVAMVVFIVAKLRNKKQLREQKAKAKKLLEDKEKQYRQELETKEAEARKELEEKDKQHAEVLEAERQTHRMQQAALSGRLKRSNEELRDISKRLELSLSKNAQYELGVSNDYAAFINDPICKHIVGVAHKQQFKSKTDYLIYKDNALSKEQLLDLRNAVQKHLPRFVSYIRRQYPKLTDNDMDCCCLVLLGLNEADISAMMQRAYTTVCDRSRKISRIIGTNDSLYHTLRNMLDE